MASPLLSTICQSAPLFKMRPLRDLPSNVPPVMGIIRRLPASLVVPNSQTGAFKSTLNFAKGSS